MGSIAPLPAAGLPAGTNPAYHRAGLYGGWLLTYEVDGELKDAVCLLLVSRDTEQLMLLPNEAVNALEAVGFRRMVAELTAAVDSWGPCAVNNREHHGWIRREHHVHVQLSSGRISISSAEAFIDSSL